MRGRDRSPDGYDRPGDILPIARAFLAARNLKSRRSFSHDCEVAMLTYGWPGNVRELKGAVGRAAVNSQGELIEPDDLNLGESWAETTPLHGTPRIEEINDAERQSFELAVARAGGNRAKAARTLGLSRSTFHDKVKRLGLGLKGKKHPKHG
jgi:DNA-binding NtrC family response regulator